MAEKDFKDAEKSPSGSGEHDVSRNDDGVFRDDNSSTIDAQTYAYSEDRKIGVTGAVFLILNKMVGTGGKWAHDMRRD